MSNEENDPRYQKTKDKLLSVGLAIPGTIRKTYLQCGKDNCACATKNGSPHGPYYFWNRKVGGKLTSKSVSKDKLPLFQAWVENRITIEDLLQQLLEIGQEIAASTTSQQEPGKAEKHAPLKRGK